MAEDRECDYIRKSWNRTACAFSSASLPREQTSSVISNYHKGSWCEKSFVNSIFEFETG
jgi:hypothetical protein